MSITATIAALQQLQWLDAQINQTRQAIGEDPGGNPVFDTRHKVYRHIKDRLLACLEPHVIELYKITESHHKELAVWLAKNVDDSS